MILGAARRVLGGRLRPDGRAQGCVAAADEARQPLFDGPALDQHVTAAGGAAQPDIGAEAIHLPLAAAAGVRPPEPEYVAEEELKGGSV